MADDLKINVNGKGLAGCREPGHAASCMSRLTNEIELRGPRFGCGLAQCGSLLGAGRRCGNPRSCITPVASVMRQEP